MAALLGAVLRRWKLILAILLTALIATYGLLRVVPSRYQSTVEILIFDPQQQMDHAVQKRVSPFLDMVDNTAMNTEIAVLQSKSVALRVAKELGLENDPEFQPRSRLSAVAERLGLGGLRWLEEAPQIVDDPDKARSQRLDWAAGALLQRLKVEREGFTYVLNISVASEDPAKAQRLAAAVANDYLASQREARQDALQRVANWLKGRVDDLQSRVLETEASIEKLRAEKGLAEPGADSVSDQQITQLNTQLMAARGEVAEKQAHLEQARRLTDSDGDVQDIPELTASAVISQLRQQQAEWRWRETQLRNKLGERHAEVIAARAQLAGLKMQIRAEAEHILGNMKNAYDIAVRREQSLEASLQTLTAARDNARSNSAGNIKLQQLRRVADADRKLYESYLSQYNEISQRGTLQDASARIITPAALPGAPSSPRRSLFYAAGVILGLGGGVMLALLLEILRSGVKTGAEVEQNFGYPVVGFIPFVPHRGLGRAVHNQLVDSIVQAPLSQFSEAVRAIRIGLEISSSEGAPKVILITSSLPDEGKSATAMLLAASSARSGHRTVLLDCDLRHPSTSGVFGKRQPGLSELLRGAVGLADVIVRDPTTDAYVIPAGSIVPNPADLLMSRRMHELIARLREQYDYVVIDASPLLPVVDALALATMVDKVLVVVEWSHTPRASISEAFKVLRPEAHRIAGIVLNKVDLKQALGYGHRSGYHYRSLGKYFSDA